MKHRPTVLPKKFLPRGAYRTTLDDGRRVWVIGGKIFPTKRAYFEWVNAQRNLDALIDKGAAPAESQVPAESASVESEAVNA